ncbi:GLE1-like protein-domain-containing protein [Russula earlei]|uniref:GLE1-like protein-domain-containing protein n=1 Tax=Russula earlei TaxID=71964 RepID=A0ACC0ULK2_9AGAM|nr:GLE1-like protein-domain-containing protein [Russula earlei]
MRFSARAHSPSPSPVRRRRSLSYGLQSSLYSSSSSEAADAQTDSSSESEEYSSDASRSSPVPERAVRRTSRLSTSSSSRLAGTQTPSVHAQVDDTVAAIRLRTRHHDPYEEWTKRTRREAFKTARRTVASAQSQWDAVQAASRERDVERQGAALKQDADMIAKSLAELSIRQSKDETEKGIQWNDKRKSRQAKTEDVIRSEEEKLRVREMMERRVREEAERIRKEAEKAAIEEQRKKDDAAKAAKEAEEAKARAEEEEAAKKEAERTEQARAQQALEGQATERNALGMTMPDEDWREARFALKQLKSGPIARVKANRESKKMWNEIRRKITPRVGQLTNDLQVIMNISQQLVQILRSSFASNSDVYHASLSSLAKAILLQAETEVTAEKRSAKPLAQLTFNSMNALDGFSAVFWAKLCQRTGGWAIPAPVPSKDADGTPFTPATRMKASGLREETSPDHVARVAGIMRVYFSLLLIPPTSALSREFHMPRLWTFIARLVGQPALLQSSLATELLSVALEVGGSHARDAWGSQWIKLMALLYEGVMTDPSPLGGSGPDTRASRVRLQLEIERVMGSG